MIKKTKKERIFQIVSLSVIAIAVGLCFCYLIFMNRLSVAGFKLSQLHQELAAWQNKNSALEVKVMELESYDKVTKKISQLNMVAAGQVDYILSGASFVAKK